MILAKALQRGCHLCQRTVCSQTRRTVSSGQLSIYGNERPERYCRFVAEKFVMKERIDPEQVFAVNKTDFSRLKVYGFDYDYTLAEYSENIQRFIYDKALDILVSKYGYPKDLRNQQYIPDFCIRGLHYDIGRSLMMKIDDRHIVQLDTVHKGLRKLDENEAYQELQGVHIPKRVMDNSCFRGDGDLRQLTDIFSLPEMMLLANVVDFFTSNKPNYKAIELFNDVERAVADVHIEGALLKELQANVEKYLEKGSLVPLVDKLKQEGKTLFILTNTDISSLHFGMTHMLGKNWLEAFDIVVVSAKKPDFFEKNNRSLKSVSDAGGLPNHLQGRVYEGGCCSELMQLKEWQPREVIYFGDQIYADLQSPNQSNGWFTGAVIHELAHEIHVMNQERFAREVVFVQALEELLDRMQKYRDAETRMHIEELLKEREHSKKVLKEVFNPPFGSVFRSSLQPSYFAARMHRVADVYMSSVKDLMNYDGERILFPTRGNQPHEKLLNSAYQCDGYDSLVEKLFEKGED